MVEVDDRGVTVVTPRKGRVSRNAILAAVVGSAMSHASQGACE